MGLITNILGMLLGNERNAVREIAEVFRPNAEAAAQRGHDADAAALQQFAAEFAQRQNRTWWDSFVDGLNRLPRPLMALWALWVLIWTPIDPTYMSAVYASYGVIPQTVAAIVLLIVTFFFGGRNQVKSLDFQRDVAGQLAATQGALQQRGRLAELDAPEGQPAATVETPGATSDNPALAEILRQRNLKEQT